MSSLEPEPSRPPLTVLVLSHNRWPLLERTLDSVRAQAMRGVELVVVDNGSSDGTPERIRARFPEAELVALPRNQGIHGRNVGLRRARAPVVLSLDDDIELARPGALERILECFEEDPDLAALTLKICDDPALREYAPAHWWHPRPRHTHQDRSFLTDRINEAAVAFRRDAIERVGGYYEPFFWGGEEWDLALGLLDAEYRIRYFPEPVRHLAPRGSLNHRADPRHALLIRNRCWTAFRRLPLPQALAFALPRLSLWGLRALRYGYLPEYLRGTADLLRLLPRVLRERHPIAPATRRRLRMLRRSGAEAR